MSIISRISRQTSITGEEKVKRTQNACEYVKLNPKDLPQTEISFNDPYVDELRRQKDVKIKVDLPK